MTLSKEEVKLKGRWGSHSLRRMCDSVALEYCEANGIDTSKVEAAAGWREAERAQRMTTHYDEVQLRRRIANTMYMSNL